MSFNLGKPILVMLLVSAISGGIILLRNPTTKTDMEVWLFSESHANILRGEIDGKPSLIQQAEKSLGRSVRVNLVSSRALDARLLSLFMSGRTDATMPDLVEMEIGSVGKFFRPPISEIGFLPLNQMLTRSGWDKHLVSSRLALWGKQGVIFGIPHDVHPVSITYRKDLFDQAGVNLSDAKTWPEFQEKCLAFQKYWCAKSQPRRYAMQLPSASSDCLQCMLLQQGINLIDDHDHLALNDPRVAKTVLFYAQLVAGPNRIAAEATPGGVLWTNDLSRGDLCSLLTPDWSITSIRDQAPDLAGKLQMMPMPKFDPADAPTATWGGTMIGIPRGCRDPEMSWQLLQKLYLEPQALHARRQFASILPPVISQWSDPIYDHPDPLFAGQPIGRLYADLAGQVPLRCVTPYTPTTGQVLAAVLHRTIRCVESGDTDHLEQRCRQWLNESQDYLQKLIQFGNSGQ